MRLLLLFVIFCFFASCSSYPDSTQRVLSQAGKKEKELEYVLEYYSKNASDSLKLKAAFYLIGNLEHQCGYTIEHKFDDVFNSLGHVPAGLDQRRYFETLLDSVHKINPMQESRLVKDMVNIDKGFLIRNIDLAFREWLAYPPNKRADFKEFCDYILPYRVMNEPLEKNNREYLSKKYHWAKKLLLRGAGFTTVIDSVLKTVGFRTSGNFPKYYHTPLATSQVEKSKFGICDDGVTYFVNVFRALGLVSAHDFISQWGNHHVSGHSWIYVKYGKDEYSVNIMPNGKDNREGFKGESIPKVLRTRTFSSFFKKPDSEDVTSFYRPTVDLTFANGRGAHSLSLNIYNSITDWAPIQTAEVDAHGHIWKNVGVNVLYIIGQWDNNVFKPFSYPFFINEDKRIEIFRPNLNTRIHASLLRKYGLASARNHSKIEWLQGLCGATIEIANDTSFKKKKLLYQIPQLNSFHLQKVYFKKKYQGHYLRFNANGKTAFLSQLVFFDEKGDTLKASYLDPKSVQPTKPINSLCDNNPSTYFGNPNLCITYRLGQGSTIKSFEYQARNDDNDIRKGDLYELFCWNKGWSSLGELRASDTLLKYRTPFNAVFLLKDLSRGAETHVFTITKDGRQKWLGFEK